MLRVRLLEEMGAEPQILTGQEKVGFLCPGKVAGMPVL